MRHTWWRTKRSWPLFSPTFFFLFLSFFFFFFSAFYFSPTLGNLPCVKISFPQYFGITRRYMQKIFLFSNLSFFLRKKTDFRTFFLYGQRSVTEPGPTPSPWSIALLFSFFFPRLLLFTHFRENSEAEILFPLIRNFGRFFYFLKPAFGHGA